MAGGSAFVFDFSQSIQAEGALPSWGSRVGEQDVEEYRFGSDFGNVQHFYAVQTCCRRRLFPTPRTPRGVGHPRFGLVKGKIQQRIIMGKHGPPVLQFSTLGTPVRQMGRSPETQSTRMIAAPLQAAS